jgi:hypothetical protein
MDVTVSLDSEDPKEHRLTVRVREGASETSHAVSLSRDMLGRLSPAEAPDAFVKRCFAFLLEREPKESILRRFDVSVISRYFPEFEQEIRRAST